LNIAHADYGGVNEWFRNLTFCSLKHCVVFGNFDDLKHPRYAHTIIDDSIWCTNKRRRPDTIQVNPLRVLNIATEESPIIHIGGLLPASTMSKCTIITPSVGLPVSLWGIRKLSKGEIFNALDLSVGRCEVLRN
jgi:hypothetical protein